MKKLLIGLFVMVTLLSVAQPSSSCLTCPPSGVGNSGKVLTSNGGKKAVWGVAGGSPFATINNSDYQIDTLHKFFVGTIDTHSHVMIAHYFDSIRNTASFHIDDTLGGEFYIPHWSAGFGDLDYKFSGVFGYGLTDTSMGTDFGWKNYENDESRHIKIFNDNPDYYRGRGIVIEAQDIDPYQRGKFDFQPHGIGVAIDEDSAGPRYFIDLFSNVANGNVLTINSTLDTLSFNPTAFTTADSATIYATTPTAGTTYYCSNCSGNGVTGRIVSYFGSLWRRLSFD